MQHITIYDFLLLPLYLYLFYILVKRKSLKYSEKDLRKIFLTAFFLRMLGSITYSLVVQYYYGYGDSFTFYMGGNFIIEQIQNNFENIKYLFSSSGELQQAYSHENGSIGGVNGYMAIDSSVAVMKASAIIAVLSFNKFLITSLFFGLFSFAGQWKLFKVFDDISKGKNRKILAIAVLYTPAIWFWGSGLMKESLCLGCLGYMISIIYNGIINKKITPMNWALLALFILLIYILKSYIIIILLVSSLFTAMFVFFQLIRPLVIRILVTLLSLTIIFFFLSIYNFSDQINELAHESFIQIESYQKNYQITQEEDETSQGGFEMVNLNPSLSSIAWRSPFVIFSCLFRPFMWESNKLIILLSSLESTLLLLSTLYLLFKTKFWGFFKIIFSDRYNFFCFILSILFATVIGFTTYNFGTMVRYKIMLLPFFYFLLFRIYLVYKNKPSIK